MSTRQWSVLSNRSILELPGKPFVWRPISVYVLPVRPGLHLVEHLEIWGHLEMRKKVKRRWTLIRVQNSEDSRGTMINGVLDRRKKRKEDEIRR